MKRKILLEEEIQEIVRRFVANDSKTKIAKEFGICRQTVSRIIMRNQQRVNECITQKKEMEKQGDMDFFQKIVKARDLALDVFIKKLEENKVSPRTLVTAIGVFTDKLAIQREAPEAVRIIWGWDKDDTEES